MKWPDPFERFERDLNYWEAPDRRIELPLPADSALPDDERQLRFLVYLGLWDLLVERLWERCEDDA